MRRCCSWGMPVGSKLFLESETLKLIGVRNTAAKIVLFFVFVFNYLFVFIYYYYFIFIFIVKMAAMSDHITSIPCDLHWLPVDRRIDCKVLFNLVHVQLHVWHSPSVPSGTG